MPTPMQSSQFPDCLDPRFQQIFHEQYDQLPDMLPELFDFIPHNGRDEMKWSEVGALSDWDPFEGNVVYDSMNEGYDTTMIFTEWTKGIQVRKTLFEDDQSHIFEQKPESMATALNRTRQKHGSRVFGMGFSNDPLFYVRSEGVPVFSTAHTTRAPGVSTASGFSNAGVDPLSAVAVKSARVSMRGFRDDRGNRMDINPDELWIPTDLYETAFEIVQSDLKPDSALNNQNVHKGKWKIHEWPYMDDSPKNWFMAEQRLRKKWVKWCDRVSKEFAMIEDFDTLIGKWRGRVRYANAVLDWRWGYGQLPA